MILKQDNIHIMFISGKQKKKVLNCNNHVHQGGYYVSLLLRLPVTRGVGYSHKWPIWVCAAPNPPLFTLTRSLNHHLFIPVRSKSTQNLQGLVRSPWIVKLFIFSRKLVIYNSCIWAQNVSDCTTEHLTNKNCLGEAPQTPLAWVGNPLPHPPPPPTTAFGSR